MGSVTGLPHAVLLLLGCAAALLIISTGWLWWQMVRRKHQANIEGAVAAERNRMAMELHDDALQNLYAASLRLEKLVNALELVGDGAVNAQDEICQTVAALGKVARSIRRVVGNEPSSAVSVLGEELPALVAELASSYGVPVEMIGKQPMPLVIGAEAEQVCHIVREAVSNALRHGKAQRVRVEVSAASQVVTVKISDNGVGFKRLGGAGESVSHSRSGGLEHMRRRAAILEGELEITGAPGQGVVITLVFPQKGGPI